MVPETFVLLGRVYPIDEGAHYYTWDYQGIFSTLELACEQMLDDTYFAHYVTLNQILPHATEEFPDPMTREDVRRMIGLEK